MRETLASIARTFRTHGVRSLFLIFTEFERKVSALTTGVPAGFFEQFHGNVVRSYFALTAPVDPELRARGKVIRKTGFVKLGASVDEVTIDKIVAAFERKVETRDASLRVTNVAGRAVSEAIEFAANDPDLKIVQQAMTDRIIEALRATLGTNFEVISYTIWRNHNLPDSGGADVYSNRWHTDGARTDEYKLFVFLHDVMADHGGTIIATREESRLACRSGYWSRKNYAGATGIFKTLDEKSCMTGPKGYAYIFSPNLCLHRAGVPEAGLTRTVLMVRVLASRHLNLEPRVEERVSVIGRLVKRVTTYIGHNDP
jgi:hypothetical protein